MMLLLAKDFDDHENTIDIMREVDYLIRFSNTKDVFKLKKNLFRKEFG